MYSLSIASTSSSGAAAAVILPHELLSSVDERVCGFESPILVLLDNRCFFLSLRYKYAPLLRVTILLVFLNIRKKIEWNG